MTIKVVEDQINGGEITLVEGVVAQISFKDIAGGPDRFGNTHRAGVRIDDDWVNNINIKTKDGYDPAIRFNAGNNSTPDWQTLEVGDKVRIVATPNEYNGKTYYNSGTSKIKLLEKGDGAPPAAAKAAGSTQKAAGGYKRDNSGVSTGHAINVAINVLGSVDSPGEIIDLAKKAHDLTVKLKTEYAEKNPEMSEYDVGAMVGQSVLSASHYVENVADIEEVARATLDIIVPEVSAYVKGADKKEEPKKPAVKKPVAKKAVAKKATTKIEPEPREDNSNSDDDPDMDDDIPF